MCHSLALCAEAAAAIQSSAELRRNMSGTQHARANMFARS